MQFKINSTITIKFDEKTGKLEKTGSGSKTIKIVSKSKFKDAYFVRDLDNMQLYHLATVCGSYYIR